MEEKTLIAECVKGNAKAQKLLFDKYASKMLAVCMRYFSNKMEAEDVFQEGFVKVFKNIGDFKNLGSFEGWIRRIFIHAALDELRKHKDFLVESDVQDIPHQLSPLNNRADNQLLADDLMKMVMALPDGYRTIFNMFALEGYSHKEIAELLNISENTSKSQYFRAKALLRTQLEKIDFER